MNTRNLALVIATTFAAAQLAFSQGPVNPPGPPAPTMKSLDELAAKLDEAIAKLAQAEAKAEKRTPISSLPFTINEPGSYYFTGNLQFTDPTGTAITIAASSVTLDLMGFTLGSVSAVTGNAISVSPGVRNVAIRNGTIAGNTTVTTSGNLPSQTWTVTPGGFGTGLVSNAWNSQFSHLRISGCRQNGITATSTPLIEHVTVRENGSLGIGTNSGKVANCIAAQNGSTGINAATVTNSTATSNDGTGISASLVTDSYAGSNRGIGISGSSVVNGCVAVGNGGDGIQSSGVVAFCRASSNNQLNNGSVDIDAPSATRTGNNPTP